MPEPATGVALNTIEVRFSGGMLALNRLLMTLQNKRMPVAGFTLAREAGDQPGGMRATILLDCPPEPALRYTALISSLEDVSEVGPAEDWRTTAESTGIEAHEDDGTVVASGDPEKVEGFLAALGDGVEDMVRLGPLARPEGEAGGGV